MIGKGFISLVYVNSMTVSRAQMQSMQRCRVCVL